MGATQHHGFIRPCLLQDVFEKYRFSSTNFLLKPLGSIEVKIRLQKGFDPIFVTKYNRTNKYMAFVARVVCII